MHLLAELTFLFVPASSSSMSGQVDLLFWFLVLLTLGVLAVIFGPMVFFLYKYRKGSPADRSPDNFKTWKIEATWTLIPPLLGLGIFTWSATLFAHLKTPPDSADALESQTQVHVPTTQNDPPDPNLARPSTLRRRPVPRR